MKQACANHNGGRLAQASPARMLALKCLASCETAQDAGSAQDKDAWGKGARGKAGCCACPLGATAP